MNTFLQFRFHNFSQEIVVNKVYLADYILFEKKIADREEKNLIQQNPEFQKSQNNCHITPKSVWQETCIALKEFLAKTREIKTKIQLGIKGT